MSIDGNALGGRLPLYGSEALNPAQKALYNWLMDVAVPWAGLRISTPAPKWAGSLDLSIRLC